MSDKFSEEEFDAICLVILDVQYCCKWLEKEKKLPHSVKKEILQESVERVNVVRGNRPEYTTPISWADMRYIMLGTLKKCLERLEACS